MCPPHHFADTMKLNTLLIALVTLVWTGCFSGGAPAPTSVSTPQLSISTESIFPHKSDWNTPEQHGVYVKEVLQYNTSTCTACHDADGTANTTKGGAPGCRSCHTVFPHTEQGITLESHGHYVMKNGKTECATQCHGTDLKGGLNGVACTKCHSAYPHASGWSSPSVHGPAAKGDLKLNCILCHGDDFNGGKVGVSCVDCHKGKYPHPTGWAAPEVHGAFAVKNGVGKCATQCHGVQLDGGLSGVSCITCHNVWPHPKNTWLSQHGEQAQAIGISGCMGCHKNDATGGTTGVTCTQCHTALPNHADADWTTGGHGKLVMQQTSVLTDPKGCPLCHGQTLQGGKQPTLPLLKPVPGCDSCHASYPTLHAGTKPAWNTYAGHGTWVMGQIVVSNGALLTQVNDIISNCKLCHGDDLMGGKTGKSCYKCHANFPHNMDPTVTPWLAKHGVVASTETAPLSCATANCHGTDLKGIPTGENDISKKLVLGCADCHIQMPHQATWSKTHGASATVDPNTCIKCHGNNWTGSGSAPTCYNVGCHNNYPLPHRKADGSADLQWKTPTKHGATVMSATGNTAKDKAKTLTCTTCHDSGNTPNPSPSCYSCHPSFPHAPPTSLTIPVFGVPTTYTFSDATWGGYDKGHGRYVAIRAKLNKIQIKQQIQNECATQCHGSDLKGGLSGISCYQCHSFYPHPAGDAWAKAYNPADLPPGGPHALTALQKGVANTCLTNCHGTKATGDFKGDNNCSTCHSVYPHPAGWTDDHTQNAEYPPHALGVIDTKGTATKSDDTFVANTIPGMIVGFAECAKCHGPTLDFAKLENFPLPDGDKTTVSPIPGVTVKRCTACHIYPHQKIQDMKLVMSDWKTAHGVSQFYWTFGPGFTGPEDSCGKAGGKTGCHATGPTKPQCMGDYPTCGLCHGGSSDPNKLCGCDMDHTAPCQIPAWECDKAKDPNCICTQNCTQY